MLVLPMPVAMALLGRLIACEFVCQKPVPKCFFRLPYQIIQCITICACCLLLFVLFYIA